MVSLPSRRERDGPCSLAPAARRASAPAAAQGTLISADLPPTALALSFPSGGGGGGGDTAVVVELAPQAVRRCGYLCR